MAKKAASTSTGGRKIGESEVKSLDGIVFGSKDSLPSRQQTIDPARLAAAKEFVEKLAAGNVAGDGKDYPTQNAAHLACMVYRRLAVLGISRGATRLDLHNQVFQTATGAFRWGLSGSAPKAAPAKTTSAKAASAAKA